MCETEIKVHVHCTTQYTVNMQCLKMLMQCVPLFCNQDKATVLLFSEIQPAMVYMH